MRTFLAILIGKSISFLTRLLKIGGGSAAPGLYALKIDPNLIQNLTNDISKNVIITGTNGKTTTAKMLDHFAKNNGLNVIRNHTGSNLERGITSTLISHSHLTSGKLKKFDLGIWELDEAAFNKIAPLLKPDIIVFLNAFRDQLDRYGEVNTVVKKWREVLKTLDKDTLIIINGDDTNVSSLVNAVKGKSLVFGIKDRKIQGELPAKQNKPILLDLEATNLNLQGLESTQFQLKTMGSNQKVTLSMPGIYHIYDFLAAYTTGINLGINPEKITNFVKTFSPAFGRVERFIFKNPRSQATSTSEVGSEGYIFLIKNPVGATQVFETIAPNLKPGDRLLIALNDNFADGTDVSWIWDGEFEKLLVTGYKLQVTSSGSRTYDLAVRLKYAGINPKNIVVEPNIESAFIKAQKDLKGRLFILPTYTAMLELQKVLVKHKIKEHYWKEE